MPAEATVWGYVLISIMPAAPELEPWMATDYKTEEVCQIDRKKLEEVLPFRRAWCIPSPKPTKEYTRKRTVRKR